MMQEDQEIDSVTKRPLLRKTVAENLRLTVKMRNRMRDGDTVASITSITVTPVTAGATPVTYSGQVASGTDIQAKFAGGEHFQRYEIEVLGLSAGGDVLEGRVTLLVRN